MELRSNIETPLDEPVAAGSGAGTALILEGWVFCREYPIRRLTVELGGRKFPVVNHGNARQDVLVAFQGENAAHNRHALLSGFWTTVPLCPQATQQQVPVRLLAQLENGDVLATAPRTVRIAPASRPARCPNLGAALPSRPRVCICMTSYNPSEQVFRRQIDSIRAQSYDNWICIIQDDWSSYAGLQAIRRVLGSDPRFILQRNERNLGFYSNFERVLASVPPDCDLVCLADQDDFWYPGKLARLIAGFATPDTTLVYSDMRIVDNRGKVVSDTFWSTRRNNYTDLETLFFANTISGASTMFKAALLPRLLPFPPKRGLIYHDWWIGLVALASGRINYIGEPLYDYYQHAGNVVGWSHIGRIVSIRQFLRSDPYRRELAQVARTMYNYDCKFLAATIQTLRLRVPESDHDVAIDRLARLTDRPLRTLAGQVARAVLLKRASQNREKNIFMAHAVMRMLNAYFARRQREIVQKFATPAEAAANQPGSPPPGATTAPGTAGLIRMPVDTFERKCQPLTLDVRQGEPPRVNMFLATIDFKYFFGGYVGMFQLAKHIANSGFKVRFILAEQTDFQPALWRQQIQRYAGLEDIFDLVEVEYRFDRSIPLAVSPEDRFIATSCWTAWLADAAARHLGPRPFVFMIQEYEPYFVAHGSYYALSHAAYDLNLFGVFSTELLREFFRKNRFGIYRHGPAAGDERSISFHNAILKFDVTESRLRQRQQASSDGDGGKGKFLFYCRPEAHAQRNMFELGILALRRAISQGTLNPRHWEFYGIGTVGDPFVVPLPGGAELSALPKMSLEEYASYLPDFDLGMSLMYTPHPSLVPLEMASAGLIAVTNSYANKTADALRCVSSNFEVGAATVEDLADALARAAARVDDCAGRAAGSRVNWPTSWDQAFAPDVIQPLINELSSARHPRGTARTDAALQNQAATVTEG